MRQAQVEKDPGCMASLIETMLGKAKAGDKDAAAFIGKYLLGNGKIALDEIYNPPLIRKSR